MYKEYELGSVCKFVGGSQPAKSYFEYKSKKTNVRLIQIRDYKNNNYIFESSDIQFIYVNCRNLWNITRKSVTICKWNTVDKSWI